MGFAPAEDKDFFQEFGLEVAPGEIAIGGTYPLFGMITKIVDDRPGVIICELNFGILANLHVSDEKVRQTVKERIFESGIFVSTVTRKDPQVEVNCQTVVFGKRQQINA
jgi:hypothetical protein